MATGQTALSIFLRDKQKLLKIENISKSAGAGQSLRMYLNNKHKNFAYVHEVNVELVKLYESLGKYLEENKIIKPKGLFK